MTMPTFVGTYPLSIIIILTTLFSLYLGKQSYTHPCKADSSTHNKSQSQQNVSVTFNQHPCNYNPYYLGN